ncbi:MAG: tyrosine-type recombinase/integrase [Alphaproteobacteria bacterium]|nr:tyrosine-type recombinase/integrase [Alphaproteobacteria bacterium]
MKAIEKNLYSRNGYYYYRTSIPKHLWNDTLKREIIIALGSKELSESRLISVQIDLKVREYIRHYHKDPLGIEDKINALRLEYNPRYIAKTEKRKQEYIFSQLCQVYLSECTSDALKTLKHKKMAFAGFIDLLGDLPLSKIVIEQAKQYKAYMVRIPKNARQRLKTTSIGNILNMDIKGMELQSPKNINKHIAALATLFNWAIRNEHYQGKNPFDGLAIKESYRKKRFPFSTKELQHLFQSAIYTGSYKLRGKQRLSKGDTVRKDALYWIPLIGLYSGMRLNEICQLYIKDIKPVKNCWVFDINNDDDDKSLKTISSIRQIPIHHKLIDMGLLDYLEEKRLDNWNRLFEDVPKGNDEKYSSVFSKRFTKLLKDLGIKRQGLCFHSLRHTFIDGMRCAGVEKAVCMALVGHNESKDIHSGYGSGYTIERLQQELNKLTYPI